MNRNIKLLWLADATSIFGSAVYTLALTLISLKHSSNAWEAGVILFSSVIPYFFIGILAGAMSDRWDRKKLMITCDIARGILVLTIPLADSFGVLTLQQIVIVSFLMTCFRAFFFPANQASIPLLVNDREEINKVNSYFGFTQSLGLMLGPSLGGILMLFEANVSQLFYIDSLSYFISAICIWFISFPKHETLESGHQKKSILRDVWQGIQFISVGDKGIAILLSAFAAQLLIGIGVTQLAIPKVLDSINLSGERMFGFVLTMIALSSALTSLWFARIKVQTPTAWIFSCYAVRGFAFFLLGLAQGMTGVMLAAVIIGFANTVSGTVLTTVLQTKTPNEMLGRVLAIRSSIGNIADALAYLFVGSVLTLFSLEVACSLFALYVFVTTGFFSFMWFRLERQKTAKQDVTMLNG